jgi:hypothetical protein
MSLTRMTAITLENADRRVSILACPQRGALHLPFPYLQGGSSRGTAEMVRQNNKLHKGLKQQVGLGIRDRHAMQSAAEVAAATYLGAISWAAI